MTKESHFRTYVIGGTKALDELLTTEYSLAELRSYFENHNSNAASLDPEYSSLSLEDVDSCFPVEVFRSKGYTVYKVEEGGYYYVFWVMALRFFFHAVPPSNKCVNFI